MGLGGRMRRRARTTRLARGRAWTRSRCLALESAHARWVAGGVDGVALAVAATHSQSAKGQRRAAIYLLRSGRRFQFKPWRSRPAVPYHPIHACLWIARGGHAARHRAGMLGPAASDPRVKDVDIPSSRGASSALGPSIKLGSG